MACFRYIIVNTLHKAITRIMITIIINNDMGAITSSNRIAATLYFL
jgi:hypothetical protein